MAGESLLENELEAREFCADLSDRAGMERLETFAALLLEENRKQNLISRKSEESLWVRHMADSAQLLKYVPRETSLDAFWEAQRILARQNALWARDKWWLLWKMGRIN